MSLRLIAPGKRKGNHFYIARGKIGGRLYEVSTGTTNKEVAERFKAGFELRVRESDPVTEREAMTFRAAVAEYEAFRDPSDRERARLKRLVLVLGDKPVRDIRHADLVSAARLLYPDGMASSLNRSVITPASSILHYAAKNGHCEWLRVEHFKERKAVTRAVSIETAELLINASEGAVKLLVLFLFRQGTRITETLNVTWEMLDLRGKTVRIYVSKTDTWREFPLDQEVVVALANWKGTRTGRVFPWTNRWQAYRAIRPVREALDVKFTPHMARHSLGTWLNAVGAGLKTIMGALGHSDPKSSLRYQDADVEVVREAVKKVGKMVGRQRKTRRKA